MSMPPAAPTPPPSNFTSANTGSRFKSAWDDPARRPSLVIGLGAVALALILVIVAIGQISGTGSTVTPTATENPCFINSNCPQGSIVPKILHVRGRSILIDPVSMNNGQWKPSAAAGRAEWVYGTLINYLIGLSSSQENSDMLKALGQADEISLDLSNGQSLKYKFAGRQLVTANASDIFAQSKPGLTLVLLGENSDQRIVITADYVAEQEVGKPAPGSYAQINTPIVIGAAKVTVLSARLVINAPGIQVGSSFYMVDFSVENIGTTPLDAAGFLIQLQDYAKQKYNLSAAASALGPNPAPKGTLQPGTLATFTSGFEVPANVTGPVLIWVFLPQANFTVQANVAVPLIGPTPTPDPKSKVVVQITQAYYTPDQSELIVVGGIGNPSSVPVTLNTADISLSTPEGVLAKLQGAEPALPLNLAPGQNQTFTLHFARVPGSSATLKILFASFQLNGLQ
ncbi:MAG TPA: hypothetical protein VFF70_13125 [Anaerolineae bacterium]|nr:hypothetical protein [Anaerolineae bacterium]